jgi:hypothetical protein
LKSVAEKAATPKAATPKAATPKHDPVDSLKSSAFFKPWKKSGDTLSLKFNNLKTPHHKIMDKLDANLTKNGWVKKDLSKEKNELGYMNTWKDASVYELPSGEKAVVSRSRSDRSDTQTIEIKIAKPIKEEAKTSVHP